MTKNPHPASTLPACAAAAAVVAAMCAPACTKAKGGDDAGDVPGEEADVLEEDTVEVEWGGECEVDGDCDDRVDCTVDRCEYGTCSNAPDDSLCDDGLQCNGVEACDARDGCEAGSDFAGCYDEDPCTMDVCVEGEPGHLYSCEHPPLDRDGDGHVDSHCDGDDCNDLSAIVYPGAGEWCFDTLDNDCDLLADSEDTEDCSLKNDGCSSPTVLTPGVLKEGFTTGALGDVQSGCDSDTYLDVVYLFDLTAPGDVEISVTGRDGFYPYVALQTTCGSSATNLECSANSPWQGFFRALVPGTYTVVVSSWTAGVFDILLEVSPPTEPPPGDTCDTAIDVSAGGTWTGDLYTATDDVVISCASWADYKDLVYTFTLDTAQDVYVRASSPMFSIYASIMEDCTAPGTYVDCGSDYPYQRTIGALPAGTYYLVIESYDPGTFQLDVSFGPPSAPPENEDCTTAEDVSEGGTIAGSMVSASADVITSCMPSGYLDTVYSFTITEQSDVDIDLEGTGDYEVFFALQDDCGVGATDIACVNTTPPQKLLRGMDPGTYFIVVESSYQGEYTMDVTFGPPTTACDSVPAISASGTHSGDTTGRPNDFATTCGASGGGPDQAYLLHLAADSHLIATMTSGSFDSVLHIRSVCDDPGSEIACDDDGAGYPLSRLDIASLAAGDYILVVDSWGWWAYGPYTMSVTITPL